MKIIKWLSFIVLLWSGIFPDKVIANELEKSGGNVKTPHGDCPGPGCPSFQEALEKLKESIRENQTTNRRSKGKFPEGEGKKENEVKEGTK